MKNFVKIFMTVVAGMMAFSCATDTTDDLGVNLGKGQKTVISVSLEESRTYLGGYDKDAKKYPMYWSEGDKISANGVMSEAAVINTDNEAVASFEFSANANLTKPYFVTYPAVANAEGKWQVKFEDEQNYKNDTFDEGVSTMYGYSKESLNVTMNHLTGILKIGIVGSEEVTLKYAQISTVDRKPIAGTFDFAFETDDEGNKVPKLTPTADAKSVINYSFGYIEESESGGQSLSTDSNYPTYIHVAVPAGTYDELYVTLYDTNGGIMYATVKADDNKPLAAGTVREFKKDNIEQLIEYTPTASNVTVIKNYDDLVKFNKAAASATKVVLANDITILDGTNDTAWTSIDGFAGEFYGNGYAIKGLTAPLFGTTTASVIKGVHLVDVDITATTPVFGALVCTYSGTSLSHCSVSGEIKVNKTYTHFGGVVGQISSTPTVSDLHNKANITFLKTTTPIELSGAVYFGGCFGMAQGSVSDCSNSGDITINSDINLTTGSWKNLNIGGLSGRFNNNTTVYNCENSGDIDFYGKYSVTRVTCGGIVADMRAGDLDGITNSGVITFRNGSEITGCTSDSNIGGLIGMLTGTKSCTNSLNKGEIKIEDGVILSTSSTSRRFLIGGCFGYEVPTTVNIVENRGAITLEGDITVSVYVGGVCGTTTKPITNASVFCNVNAQGLSNVGMLIGSAYSDAIAVTGCKVGGTILKGNATEAVTLTGENYYNYIYGSENLTEKPDESVCTYWDGTEE